MIVLCTTTLLVLHSLLAFVQDHGLLIFAKIFYPLKSSCQSLWDNMTITVNTGRWRTCRLPGWGWGWSWLLASPWVFIFSTGWLHALILWFSAFSGNTWVLWHTPSRTSGYCRWVDKERCIQILTECVFWRGILAEPETLSLPTSPLRINGVISCKDFVFWAKKALVHIPLSSWSLCASVCSTVKRGWQYTHISWLLWGLFAETSLRVLSYCHHYTNQLANSSGLVSPSHLAGKTYKEKLCLLDLNSSCTLYIEGPQ